MEAGAPMMSPSSNKFARWRRVKYTRMYTLEMGEVMKLGKLPFCSFAVSVSS